jgi:hypothetical protein
MRKLIKLLNTKLVQVLRAVSIYCHVRVEGAFYLYHGNFI